ncbi:MAG: type IV pilin N-terminal domain-containing protein [Methanocorpusculum sp.]|jgi:FlaG/FlaF family flagellin (archaellin)|nr:type IV pilin N-terminal domain-containing protein [Methanocorpusculum sp.]HJJ62551.1 type IV pilin N-terminal domain-containing protein [Methanocorpusculum sp.]
MKDDAVSPVIGVMLMLSITIIIAAVLMAFAGGMADTKPATPSVDLSAEFVKNGSDIVLRLSHNGGDALNPKDIKLTAYVTTLDASSESITLSSIFTETSWKAGDIIVLKADETQSLLGLDESGINNAAKLSTPVDIRIHHIPSSEVIMQNTILMEAK